MPVLSVMDIAAVKVVMCHTLSVIRPDPAVEAIKPGFVNALPKSFSQPRDKVDHKRNQRCS